MATSSTTKMSLKLLVDTKAERVLFTETSKDFIDFLFNLQLLPISAVMKLLNKNMVGSIGKIYESIENLNNKYLLHQNQDKDMLLKPKTLIPPRSFLLLANYDDDDTDIKQEEIEAPKLYMCRNRCPYYVTRVQDTRCTNCNSPMSYPVTYVGKKHMEVKGDGGGGTGEDGFVKEVVTYMVMDDLLVQPMSTISCITLFNKFNIKDVNSLQEMAVEFGVQEGIELLKASLQCSNVLTSVFLRNIKLKKQSNIILNCQ